MLQTVAAVARLPCIAPALGSMLHTVPTPASPEPVLIWSSQALHAAQVLNWLEQAPGTAQS